MTKPAYNTAQTIILDFFDPKIEVRPGMGLSYKAPHAYQGTPERKHFKRKNKLRLFKGHRP